MNVPEDPQSCALGSAILATIAAGIYGSFEEAVEHMVRYSKTVEPNLENHRIYQKYFAQYRKAYDTFGQWMRDTSALIK